MGAKTIFRGSADMSAYVFDPQVIHEVSCKHLGQPLPQMFDAIISELSTCYPDMIDTSQPWIYSNAGGVMIQMKLYYATTKEYLMIWGTPIGSEGHTGRNLVAFYDTVLAGEAWYYKEGEFTRSVYTPGDHILVDRGEAAGMHYPDHIWMIEYARGPLLTLLPFGLADGLLSTLDFKTVYRTLVVYFSLLSRHLSRGQKLAAGVLVIAMLMLWTGRGRRKKRLRRQARRE
jgi:hypothetical protein